ncbi:PREDICTED: uncharacterized protein LOC109482949 [Branchiostoma belcheri]|uniref:Uncharacterized protein LOC109482949 n=1 Tax=Branchiostoma belcheri TaxID=7741 RepID=A0A6P5A563_BRABE|nr:PREDICTED: uncharacterized protein LOC109482949 [Branchiostoma belcheri]KAI8499747.1 hypothetical protein Bbelb_227980 [Branchiostoma belcheri]
MSDGGNLSPEQKAIKDQFPVQEGEVQEAKSGLQSGSGRAGKSKTWRMLEEMGGDAPSVFNKDKATGEESVWNKGQPKANRYNTVPMPGGGEPTSVFGKRK